MHFFYFTDICMCGIIIIEGAVIKMTIRELQSVWYNGNRNDINFVNTCYNILTGMNVLTDEDRLRYDYMYKDMREVMEDYLYAH